jgi:hypothetical protein
LAEKKLNTQQIGVAGELLVQYKLLKHGVDSSRMATDFGVDLVAYSSRNQRPFTIQVKTRKAPEPGGGRGKLAIGWMLKDNTPADLIAVVDLSSDQAWLFTRAEYAKMAQQHSKNGVYNLYMYADETVKTKKKLAFKSEFEAYLIDNRMATFF